MTKQARIAQILSTSALCLGLAVAPAAFAAQGDMSTGSDAATTKSATHHTTKHKKSSAKKSSAKKTHHSTATKSKSSTMPAAPAQQ